MAQLARANGEPEDSAEIIAGRYRVERMLGAGGMGSVHAVVDLATGATLALKRLAPNSTEQTRSLFESEYKTLAELQHPNIVAVYDYGIDASGPFYTMELVQGTELSIEAPMPWREACSCLRDVAALLGFLHARRLLHRDLSPRNLLRGPSGRLKLIDFGALARFGPASHVVGTPPFIAPEALSNASLDQRADLFSLGALGYWLIAGAHAYPARLLSDLPRLHERPPALVSKLVEASGSESGDLPPAQLDALLAALLASDPRERPTTAAIVVDRLNAIANLPEELGELSMRGYLESSSFVGRERELTQFSAALTRAQDGHGSAIAILAAEGLGRTRLLRQLGVRARLGGALTLTADARGGQRAFAGAAQLAAGLLDALPVEALRAAAPFASDLAKVSEPVRIRLQLSPSPPAAESAGATRVRVQLALRGWIRALTATRCIAMLVDDLHLMDDETRSLLITLTEGIDSARLLIVATTSDTATQAFGSASNLPTASTLTLAPLTSSEVLELLRSIFGDVQYLARCAERLWRASTGNPSYCLDLAQRLVQTHAARYVDGVWILPVELTTAQLPSTREDAQLTRLQAVSSEARALAERLCVPHDEPLDPATCHRVSQLERGQTAAALHELLRADVLVQSDAGYAFVHASTKHALFASLEPARRARAQVALGAALAERAGDDGPSQLRAALQFLRAGALERGLPWLKRAGAFYGTGTAAALASLPRAAPLFEEAYELLRSHGAGDHHRALALGTLALSSYFVDRRYEVRFGEAAMDLYERILKVHLAHRLSRYVGAKLGLLFALLWALLCMLRERHAASLPRTIADFAAASAALTGTATALLAPGVARRYADALLPFAPLGPNHTINVVHDTSVLFSMLVSDRVAETSRGLRDMVGRMERGEVLRDLPEGRRRDYIAGIYLSLGVQACWKDGTEILRIADQIEEFSPLHALIADHFRASYYANEGDSTRAEIYRQRVETHAVRLGSTWQVELWAPVDAAKTAMRINDPLLIRNAFESLSRLASEVPSMAGEERRARGMYSTLIGHHDKAVALLEMEEAPRSVIGWTFTRGALARALNALGEHTRAKAVCEDALARCDPEDFDYPVLFLGVQLERARAEAGLGHHAAAAALLDALIAKHQRTGGAVTLGMLHEARAWTALHAGEVATSREHLTQLELKFRPSGAASLLERIGALQRAVQEAENVSQGGAPDATQAEVIERQLIARVRSQLRKQAALGFLALARTALQIASEQTSATDAFLWMPSARPALSHRGERPPGDELVAWAQRALVAADHDEQTEIGPSMQESDDPFFLQLDGQRYRAFELRGEGQSRAAFAVLALAFDGPPGDLAPALVRALAAELGSASSSMPK